MHLVAERKRIRDKIEASRLRMFEIEDAIGMGKTQLSKRLSGVLDLTEEQIEQIDRAIERLIATPASPPKPRRAQP